MGRGESTTLSSRPSPSTLLETFHSRRSRQADCLNSSRALAHHWSSTPNPPSSQKFSKYRTPLSQISLFLLLDLLGSPNPSIPSYYATTHWAYTHLSAIETRMRSLQLLESSPPVPFLNDINRTVGAYAMVSDDHLPFLAQGTEILHVIPNQFPQGIWHTMQDDGDHLDMPTVRDWARIVAAFALEWLDMMEVWDEPGGDKEGGAM
jgi:glutaminyl-peptide cyclotransferase